MHSRIEESAIYVGRLDDPAWRKLVVKAHSNAIYADGFLFHVDGSALVAAALRYRTAGTERRCDDGRGIVGSYEFHALGDFSVSAAGVLALRRPVPTPARRLLRMNRDRGRPRRNQRAWLVSLSADLPGREKACRGSDHSRPGVGSLWVFSTDGTNPRRITFDSRHESHPLGHRMELACFSRGAGQFRGCVLKTG
jgi:hypothetical protein